MLESMDVLVFKTNIQHKNDVERIRPLFNNHNNILSWNVDIEDVDKVLRIESSSNISREVENIIRQAGYLCIELE